MKSKAVFVPPEWFYEHHFAPEITWFTGAELPDLSHSHREQPHWLKNFLLHQIKQKVPNGTRELVFAHLRRAHSSFDAYEALRTALSQYGKKPRSVSTYMALLDRAEVWLTFTAQAFEIANALHKNGGAIRNYQFTTAVELSRLHKLYIASKHVPDMVSGKEFRFPDPVIIWFTTEGLKARRRGTLAFESLPAIMLQLAQEADSFASYVPAPA